MNTGQKRVKYDQLSQPQGVAGLALIQACQTDPTIRFNMGQYLSDLFQNVVDYGYDTAQGLCWKTSTESALS